VGGQAAARHYHGRGPGGGDDRGRVGEGARRANQPQQLAGAGVEHADRAGGGGDEHLTAAERGGDDVLHRPRQVCAPQQLFRPGGHGPAVEGGDVAVLVAGHQVGAARGGDAGGGGAEEVARPGGRALGRPAIGGVGLHVLVAGHGADQAGAGGHGAER